MKQIPTFLLVVCLLLSVKSAGQALVAGVTQPVRPSIPENASGQFIVAAPGKIAQLVLYPDEPRVVHTAAQLLASDIMRVSGQKVGISSQSNAAFQIVVGTLGTHPAFDEACRKNGISTDSFASQWEGFAIKSVVQADGRGGVLLVAGSQPRGTAYGLMELSRMIGVSPWYWWADVPVRTQEILALPASLNLEDSPKVKFRGIFLNDEDWGLQPWAAKTFEPETGDIGPRTYEKIFELLLRLKANAVWPAMHDCTRAFFTYPESIEMADAYGIWVGSSHCEPMLRNNVDEWHRWNPENEARGDWNFDKNPVQLETYWRQRLETSGKYDGIYTIGMRGIHDGGMPGGNNLDDKVRILNQVFEVQRAILKERIGGAITDIPQVFCPYKEVLDVYQHGASVPDDVTILWSDDNHGYIRQLSNPAEQQRSGGAGVYYHISYWGRPHDYLWMESIPVALIWEEMNKAWQTNARRFWVVNVGDIKLNEIGMSFFLDLAWDPDGFEPEKLNTYYTQFAAAQFGTQYAAEIGDLLQHYFQLGFSRKPEHMGWNSVYPNGAVQDPELSLFHYGDEVQKRLDAYEELEQKATALYELLPADQKAAFYQLVAYKVIAASNMNKKLLYAYKSRVYARQQRISARSYAQQAAQAFEKIKQATAFYNDTLVGGKWKNMVSCQPRKLPVFDMPSVAAELPVSSIRAGVVPEGSTEPMQPGKAKVYLPVFNQLTQPSYFVDVFNAGTTPLKWSAKTNRSWIQLSSYGGSIDGEERIKVSVDWNKINAAGRQKGLVRLYAGGKKYQVGIDAQPLALSPGTHPLFVEDNGVVAIEAEHYAQVSNNALTSWQRVAGLGRNSDAMLASPYPSDRSDSATAAQMSYPIYTSSADSAQIYVYCIPVHPLHNTASLRFSVKVDGGDPLLLSAAVPGGADEHHPAWQQNVLRAAIIPVGKLAIPQPGHHTLTVSMLDPGVVIDRIELVFGQKKQTYFGAPETRIDKVLPR